MVGVHSVSAPAERDSSVVPTDSISKYPFREDFCSLMCVAVSRRSDISFVVGGASSHFNKPSEANIRYVKRIFKYLRGTMDYGIIYDKNPKYSLNFFSDSDYAGDPETRRPISGFVFMLGSGAASWCSQLQRCVPTSSTEADNLAGSHSVKELAPIDAQIADILTKPLSKDKDKDFCLEQ